MNVSNILDKRLETLNRRHLDLTEEILGLQDKKKNLEIDLYLLGRQIFDLNREIDELEAEIVNLMTHG